jgi:hypothetical protein
MLPIREALKALAGGARRQLVAPLGTTVREVFLYWLSPPVGETVK